MIDESKKYRCVLLFGAPGTGKGTQGGILGNIPGFYHLAVGDVFRSIDINSPTGQVVHKYVSAGKLVPDEITIKIWKNALEAYIALSTYKPWEDLLILDGLPRNLDQAKLISDELDVLRLIHLDCKDEEDMIRRIQKRAIQENRADDANEEVIRNRFKIYREKSAPVLDFYPNDIVSNIEASGSPAEVLKRILEGRYPCSKFLFYKSLVALKRSTYEQNPYDCNSRISCDGWDKGVYYLDGHDAGLDVCWNRGHGVVQGCRPNQRTQAGGC